MEYRLEELFDLQMGKTPSRSVTEYWESGNNKWISIADLSKCGKYIYDTKECLSDIAVSESGIKQIPANTVVMSFKLSIGKTAITSEPMYSNEAIMSFRDRKLVQLLPEYIYYLLLSKNWDDGTNKAVMGKTLNKATLSKVKVNIHSMQEQQEIVCVLNQATALIELHQQQLQKLDELVKARFVELFGEPCKNSLGWNTSTVGALISVCEAGWSGNGTQRKKEPGEIAVLKVSAVTKGYFIPAECKVLDNQRNIKKYIFPHSGDLLFSRANTREMVGATAVITQDYPEHILPDKLWRIRFIDTANVIYMKYVLSDESIRSIFSSVSTGTSGSMFNVSMDKFKSITVPLPPLERQTQFAAFVEQVDKSKLLQFFCFPI